MCSPNFLSTSMASLYSCVDSRAAVRLTSSSLMRFSLMSWLASNQGTKTSPRGGLLRPRVSMRVRMLPISFVVDRGGTIRYQLIGEADWTTPNITSVIERLIAGDAKRQSASASP